MSEACTDHRPISWLRLEKLALGELSSADEGAIEAHLDECDACRACMEVIRQSEAALPPLPDAVLSPPLPWWRRRRMQIAWGGGLAAAAAALAIAVTTQPTAPTESIPGRRVAVKGGEVVLDLVREHGGSIAYEAKTFLPSDRFQVLITCPHADTLEVDVVVYQDGEASFPLGPTSIDCGNRVALPGAFRFTSNSPAILCAVFDATTLPDRTHLSQSAATGLEHAVCVSLHPPDR